MMPTQVTHRQTGKSLCAADEALRSTQEAFLGTRNAAGARAFAFAFALAFAFVFALACAIAVCVLLTGVSAQPAYALSGTVPEEEYYAVNVVQSENGTVETDATIGQVIRYAGDTRYDTVAAVNAEIADINNTYGGVIICSGEDGKFADALCASSLSGMLNYPVVLIDGAATFLDAQTRESINSLLGGIQGQIVIVGGETSVSDRIMRALREYDVDSYVQRYAGSDRYETACDVYNFGFSSGLWDRSQIIVTKGNDFPDALSVASYCSTYGVPVLLTDADEEDVEGYILSAARNSASALVVGGENSVSAEKVLEIEGYTPCERISGDDRYATSLAFAEWECTHGMDASTVGIANGTIFPDALGSSGLLSLYKAPLILMSESSEREMCDFIIESGTTLVMIFGGAGSVSNLMLFDIDMCLRTYLTGYSYAGRAVNVGVNADVGYQLASLEVTTVTGATIEIIATSEGYAFNMPSSDVTVAATFEEVSLPTVTLQQSSGGTIEVNLTKAEAGTTIVVTATPDEGYVLNQVIVQTVSGANMYVAQTDTGGTFTMPNTDVVVSVTWTAV